MAHDFEVIVVGGGLAGLSAGATAAQGGARTVVLEAHAPGGRARTTEKDGFVFNHGCHALYAGGVGMGVLRSLGAVPVGVKPPLQGYRLLIDGKRHLMPTGAATLLRTGAPGVRAKAQLARLLGLLPLVDARALAGTSTADWLRGKGLRPATEAVVRALMRTGTYTSDFESLSADAAIGQVQAAVRHGVLYLDGGWKPLLDGLARLVEVRDHTTVQAVESDVGGAVVTTSDGPLTARAVVLAPGTPAATGALLPADPGWGDLGGPVTAACLDVAVRRVPDPGYVLGVDDPLYATMQGPPARQAPEGQAVMAVIRYGARTAELDRPELGRFLAEAGVEPDDVVHERFLARMVVTATMPRAVRGGLAGRPSVDATGLPCVFVAGDWVGRDGLLADASLASGQAAARAALAAVDRAPSRVA